MLSIRTQAHTHIYIFYSNSLVHHIMYIFMYECLHAFITPHSLVGDDYAVWASYNG